MGDGYHLCCSQCDFVIEVMDGCGMIANNHNLEMTLSGENTKYTHGMFDLEPSVHQAAGDLYRKGWRLTEEGGKKLYLCPSCHQLDQKYYFQLKKDEAIYEPDYPCAHCREILKRVTYNNCKGEKGFFDLEGNQILWECPKCGHAEMHYGDAYILWD